MKSQEAQTQTCGPAWIFFTNGESTWMHPKQKYSTTTLPIGFMIMCGASITEAIGGRKPIFQRSTDIILGFTIHPWFLELNGLRLHFPEILLMMNFFSCLISALSMSPTRGGSIFPTKTGCLWRWAFAGCRFEVTNLNITNGFSKQNSSVNMSESAAPIFPGVHIRGMCPIPIGVYASPY